MGRKHFGVTIMPRLDKDQYVFLVTAIARCNITQNSDEDFFGHTNQVPNTIDKHFRTVKSRYTPA